jgi:hypothetical protein
MTRENLVSNLRRFCQKQGRAYFGLIMPEAATLFRMLLEIFRGQAI